MSCETGWILLNPQLEKFDRLHSSQVNLDPLRRKITSNPGCPLNIPIQCILGYRTWPRLRSQVAKLGPDCGIVAGCA